MLNEALLQACGGNPYFPYEIVAGGEKGSGRYKQVMQKRLHVLQRLPLSDGIFCKFAKKKT
jgi:hypothetical protein